MRSKTRHRTLAVLLAALLGAALAAPATAEVVDDNPAAVSSGPGDLRVFARGADGAIYQASRLPGGWSTWSTLGGSATSGPGAALYAGIARVLIRGADGAIYEQPWVGGPPTPWQPLGGPCASAPAAVAARKTDQLFVFCRALDDALRYRIYTPAGGWTQWSSVPGATITSQPAASSRVTGVVDVFARGEGGALMQVSWNKDHWTDWTFHENYTTAAPGAATTAWNNTEIFMRGKDGLIYWRTWSPGKYTPWAPIDATVVASGPTAVAEGRAVNVFARIGGAIAVNQLSEGRWSGWTSLGPVAASPCVGAPAVGAGLRISAAITSADGVEPKGGGGLAVVGFGRAATIRGMLTDVLGQPLPAAPVCIGVRSVGQPFFSDAGSVMTAPDGSFSYTLPAGPSRVVEVGHRSPLGTLVKAQVRTKVPTRLRFRASPARLRNGQRVKLRGRIVGQPIPPGGLLVEIQAWRPRRWQTFQTTRANRRGVFRTTYRFSRTTGTQTYRMRARVGPQASYSYTTGISRVAIIRVRG